MPDPKEYTAGSSSLVLGVDSYTQSAELGEQEMVMSQNTVCRGGIVQTRPGTRTLFCLPDGNFQGKTLFTPDNGVAHIVAAVDGKIYVSAAPFTSYRRLWNLQFSITAKNIAWATCLKSTDYDISGNLISLPNPYSVLVMQDGLTRAAYWDGGNSGHLNPGAPPFPDQTDVSPGYTETPIGLWSVWSGNRLWVSRENQVFASDIGNPLKFTEATYLNEARAFYLSGPCTGMIETADQQGIIVFTEKNGTFFQSSIQQRTDWLNTPDFQKVIIPNVGCVAPRSLVTQYGLTWWFGPRGFTNINAALRQNVTSRIDYQDNEMFASKSYLGPDLSSICSGFYENYLMTSTPSGDVRNRHTWVLDQAPFEGNVNAWAGFWTGWRPIEWSRGLINGDERVFFGSVDYDGKNRVWEAMLSDRTDNGCRITCYAQLRDHAAGNLDQKKYDWSKFYLSQIYGPVDLNVYVASTKGGYQLQKKYHLEASEGQVYADVEYSEDGPYLVSNRVQSRTIRTPGDLEDNECNKCGVESKEGNLIDYAFTHLLIWSGQMGIRAYQMHMHGSPDRAAGDCEEDEVAPRTLNLAGCSGLELLVDGEVFDEFMATAEGATTLPNGSTVYIQRTATSILSQVNAQAMAECAVEAIINQLVGRNLEPGNYDGVIVSGPITPPPTPVISDFNFESDQGTATLCGIDEYVTPSVPPKKYRRQQILGGSSGRICNLGGCAFLGGDGVNRYTGFLQYSAVDCSIDNQQINTLYTTAGGTCFGAETPYASGSIPLGFTPPYVVPHFTFTQTNTQQRWDADGVCDGFASHGFLQKNLEDEDTETDAIARATPAGSGTSAQSFRETRGAGDFTFLWQDATALINAGGLVSGENYEITLDILTENYSGGSPVTSQLVHAFSASASSEVVSVPIPCAPGKQVTASNPTITHV